MDKEKTVNTIEYNSTTIKVSSFFKKILNCDVICVSANGDKFLFCYEFGIIIISFSAVKVNNRKNKKG